MRCGVHGRKTHGVRQPVAGFEVVVRRVAEVVDTRELLRHLADQLGFGRPRSLSEASGEAALVDDLLKLLTGAAREELGVRPPVGAHVGAEVARHTVEQRVAGIEAAAIALAEGKDGQQQVQPVKILVAEGFDRLIERRGVPAGAA